LAQNITWPYRRATWQDRALPEVLLIGAQKAGTSSLYAAICQHPQFVPPSRQEVHYFDGGLRPQVDQFARGEPWYRAHFPRTARLRPGDKTLECSPLYLFSPLAPERIRALLPSVRLIALLRDPTERAISHYFHERRLGMEPLGLLAALQAEDARVDPALQARDYRHPAFVHHTYKARGHYAVQLERYLRVFDRSQLLVVRSEDFFADPVRTLAEVFAFTGVRSDVVIPDLRPRNVAPNRVAVDPAARAFLVDHFEPHEQALYDLLGEGFAGWSSGGGAARSTP